MSEKMLNKVVPYVLFGGIVLGNLWLGYAMFASYHQSAKILHIKK